METEAKKTALFDEHVKLGAKMVPFASFMMPVQYKEGIIKEHTFTRENAGVFDISHMGQYYIKGKDSLKFLNSIVPQDVTKLNQGCALYCHLINDNGGVVDDFIIYNTKNILDDVDYLLVVNASGYRSDFEYMLNKKRDFDVEIINKSDELSMIAIQGPKSSDIVEKMGLEKSLQPKFFKIINTKLINIPLLLIRGGYTGEDGFELVFKNEFAHELFLKSIELGAHPIGLGARDTLRLEAGLPLYGHEMDKNTTPLESSLGFFIPKEKEQNFSAKDFILGQKNKTIKLRKKLFPYIMQDRQIARNGDKVIINNIECGYVTSGTMSPTLKKNIGFFMVDFSILNNNAYENLVAKLNNPKESLGMEVQIVVRNKLCNAQITHKPFVEKKYEKSIK